MSSRPTTQEHNLNWIAGFLCGIADDVLRDVFQRGKYRDVILPMVVLHRLDTVLASSKLDVLGMNEKLDVMGITEQRKTLALNTTVPSTTQCSSAWMTNLSCSKSSPRTRCSRSGYAGRSSKRHMTMPKSPKDYWEGVLMAVYVPTSQTWHRRALACVRSS